MALGPRYLKEGSHFVDSSDLHVFATKISYVVHLENKVSQGGSWKP